MCYFCFDFQSGFVFESMKCYVCCASVYYEAQKQNGESDESVYKVSRIYTVTKTLRFRKRCVRITFTEIRVMCT